MEVTEIKYFSPDEKDEMPNGVYFQKGGFVHECEINAGKFLINTTGSVTGKSITVLPTNSVLDEEKVSEWISNQKIIGFSIGKFFYGTYGKQFGKDSLCILIDGMKWKLLINLNENFLIEFKIEKALLKDLNSGKIFLMELS